jgi:hypothetical protein
VDRAVRNGDALGARISLDAVVERSLGVPL